MRAREPDRSGKLTVRGFEIAYETFGDPQDPAVLFLPTWQIVDSRIWKMQVPYLSRFFHVVTVDIPGNGRAERTTDVAAFEYNRITQQMIDLLDHLGIDRASIVGFSRGCHYALLLGGEYPERVSSIALIALTNGDDWAPVTPPGFWERRDSYDGQQRFNAHFWREHYREWLQYFFGTLFPEPHSSKAIDDGISWGNETTAEILIASYAGRPLLPEVPFDEVVHKIRCPVTLIHGTNDNRAPIEASEKLVAKRPDWTFVRYEGCGHAPHVREPVKTNQVIADFFDLAKPRHTTWRRGMSRKNRRALFISSPIGLGHIQRDLAIARELRTLVPDLEIDWLAQNPVATVLRQAGETIHPMSRDLSSESAHWENQAGEHELHCFCAFREMDEILLANFMVFLDAVRETPYDLWIGDEAWEVDHFLHENPELKTAPFVFMTDFVGFLPMDRSADSREAFLTTDFNAEKIEQIARYGRIRDRALYVGDLDDLVPESFGPGLPGIREWTEEYFTPVGYALPFDPADFADTSATRRRLGYDPDRPLVIAAVGGTATGRHLLRKTLDAWPLVHRESPDASLVVIAGPRIDPGSLPKHSSMEIKPYVHNLYEHLAAADLGVVQGGLSTTMELTATRRPFLSFPLRNHFEQVYHVARRLDRYNAGTRLDYHETTAEQLAEAITGHMGADTSRYRPVEPGAAERAACEIVTLI